jgi:hypothetical protein
MFGRNSAVSFADRIYRLEGAQRLPNRLVVIGQIENISLNGSAFTVSNKRIL